MSHEQFSISYDGGQVSKGRIDINELAPSLLSLNDLVQRINKLINPKDATIKLEAVATREGSFLIDLDLSQTILGQAGALLSGASLSDVKDIIDIIFGENSSNLVAKGIGLFALYKWLSSRSIEKVEKNDENATFTATDGSTIIVDNRVFVCANDSAVVKSLLGMAKPLTNGTCDTMKVAGPALPKTGIAITESDVEAFKKALESQDSIELTRQEYNKTFQISNASFTDGKWRLKSGDESIFVTIADQGFAKRVAEGEIEFGSKDTLVCKVEAVEYQKGDRVTTEYTILEVLHHNKPPVQFRIPGTGN